MYTIKNPASLFPNPQVNFANKPRESEKGENTSKDHERFCVERHGRVVIGYLARTN